MNTITRRNALAGAAALPLLPAAALALPVERDPVVMAFEEWQRLADEHDRACGVYGEMETRHGISSDEAEAYQDETVGAASGRKNAAEERISQMIPTTPAGLAAQLAITVDMFGLNGSPALDAPEDNILRSMLAGAERMAGVSYGRGVVMTRTEIRIDWDAARESSGATPTSTTRSPTTCST